jgi:hypothetical protein
MFVVHTRDITHENFNPAVALTVALSTQNVSMRSSGGFLGLNYQKGVPVLALFLRFASICWSVLPTDLSTSNGDGSKVLAPALRRNLVNIVAHCLQTRSRTLS